MVDSLNERENAFFAVEFNYLACELSTHFPAHHDPVSGSPCSTSPRVASSSLSSSFLAPSVFFSLLSKRLPLPMTEGKEEELHGDLGSDFSQLLSRVLVSGHAQRPSTETDASVDILLSFSGFIFLSSFLSSRSPRRWPRCVSGIIRGYAKVAGDCNESQNWHYSLQRATRSVDARTRVPRDDRNSRLKCNCKRNMI